MNTHFQSSEKTDVFLPAFVLDGEYAGNITHSPTGKSVVPFLYNQLGFAAEDLSNITHTLEIHAGAPENGSSVVLFDYIVYTYVVLLSLSIMRWMLMPCISKDRDARG